MGESFFTSNEQNGKIYNVLEQFLQFYGIKYYCIIMVKKYAK